MFWIWFVITWLALMCFIMMFLSFAAERTERWDDYTGTIFWAVAFAVLGGISIALYFVGW